MKRLIALVFIALLLSPASALAGPARQAACDTFTIDATEFEVCKVEATATATNTPAATATPTATNTPSPTATATPTPFSQGVQTEYVFFDSTMNPVTVTSSTSWQWATCLSCATRWLWTGENMVGDVTIVYARVVVHWAPNTSGASTGVRFVKFDGGPINIEQIAAFETTGLGTIIPSGADVTTAIQYIYDNGTCTYCGKGIGIQIRGNGTVSPLVYDAFIEVIRRVP